MQIYRLGELLPTTHVQMTITPAPLVQTNPALFWFWVILAVGAVVALVWSAKGLWSGVTFTRQAWAIGLIVGAGLLGIWIVAALLYTFI
jgi:hypothetical protein